VVHVVCRRLDAASLATRVKRAGISLIRSAVRRVGWRGPNYSAVVREFLPVARP
jgi:hypothetical protein